MKNEFKFRAVIFGFASKMKRNYWFLPLIVLLLLLCMIMLASSFGVIFTINAFEKAYNEQHGDMAHLTFYPGNETAKTYAELKADGITDFYTSVAYDVPKKSENIIRIDKRMADELKMSVNGKWFSESNTDDYFEAIVSFSLKSRYKIGEFYDVEAYFYDKEIKRNVYINYGIKVIGSWFNDAVQIKDVWGNYSSGIDTITIVDNFDDDEYANEVYTKGDVDYFKKKYDVSVESVKAYHEHSVMIFKQALSQAIYILVISFSLTLGAMMGNTLLKEDYERRRNAVYFIYGQSKKTYLLTKIFEFSLVLIVSAIVFFGVLMPFSASLTEIIFMIQTVLPISAAVGSFATIYGLYALAEGFYIFKTFRSNILEEVSKE